MSKFDWFCLISIIVCILIFPIPGVPVSPMVLFETGTAHHMEGNIDEAKAYYTLVMEYEKHFNYNSININKYKQLATHNLRVIKLSAIKDSPLFKRGK